MKYTSCLEKLRAPLFGVLFGALALGFSTQSATAHPLKVQGCVKLDGVLTLGVVVEAFDSRTCTSLISTCTDRNGDFVLFGPSGSFNETSFLQITAPNGCIEIVDSATLLRSVITDPADPRFGFIALCVDVQCACVPCTTGISKIVLQYLGTSEQVVAAWATTTAGSKSSTSGSKAKTVTGTTGSKNSTTKSSGSKGTSTKPSSKPAPTPATPLFCAPVKPCTTLTIIAPTTSVSGGGSKGVKTGSKGIKTSSKGVTTGSKNGGKKGTLTGLTLFVGSNVNTRLDLSCNGGVTNGQVIGMFKVIRLENAAGQRICPTPKPPQTGNCLTSGKPNQITFQYSGGNCSTAVNSQPRGQKYNCSDSGAIAAGPVRIVISSSATPTTTGFFAGTVTPGQTFVVRAGSTWTKSKKSKVSGFGSNTYAYIYSGGVLVERIQIHTSCSAPLIPGETFGALKLITYAIVP